MKASLSKKRCGAKSGIALVTILCFIAILSVLISVLMISSSTQLKIARSQVDMEKALYVAESGVECAVSYILDGGDTPSSFSGTVGDGVFCVTIVSGASLDSTPYTIAGEVNINPNNSPDNEFTLVLPDGTVITRDTLKEDFAGYQGDAVSVHFKPKGSGTQDSMLIDGQPYAFLNKNTYDVVSATMTVNLYNDKINPQGKATGKWWISMATTCAEVTIVE